MATDLEEENFKLNPVELRLKFDSIPSYSE